MLFGYSVAATAENWLHECLFAMVQLALTQLNAGEDVHIWPDCVPALHRPRLRNRTALRAKFEAFCQAAMQATQKERCNVLAALSTQNNLPAIFDGNAAYLDIDDLPDFVREPAKDLFAIAFKVLGGLKIRDRHYKVIYDNLPARVCPFCGIEPFEAPSLARESLDHYLAISHYPFAGSNLRNLAPMGGKCNSAYKNVKDVLRDAAGNRRRCFDPYGAITATVSLLNSRPFEGEIKESIILPRWQIDLVGSAEEISTWDDIFEIRNRYRANVLDAEFRTWMDHFAQWCIQEVGQLRSQADVVEALNRYLAAVVQEGFVGATFLKKATFEMLKTHCIAGDISGRLVAWFISLVSPDEGAIVIDQDAARIG